MVYIKDIDEFIKLIITERNTDPLSANARVAVDSGRGFLKVTMNIFNTSDKTSNQPNVENAGVKRCSIVAIAEEVSEHNGNLRRFTLITFTVNTLNHYSKYTENQNQVWSIINMLPKSILKRIQIQL